AASPGGGRGCRAPAPDALHRHLAHDLLAVRARLRRPVRAPRPGLRGGGTAAPPPSPGLAALHRLRAVTLRDPPVRAAPLPPGLVPGPDHGPSLAHRPSPPPARPRLT